MWLWFIIFFLGSVILGSGFKFYKCFIYIVLNDEGYFFIILIVENDYKSLCVILCIIIK